MHKILQARFQQYTNWELSDVQVGLEKAEEPEIKFTGSRRKQGDSNKHLLLLHWLPQNLWTGVDFPQQTVENS